MKIALIGYGKMGKAIEAIALERGHTISLKIGLENEEDFTNENVQEADVCIEFSSPESAFSNVKKCLENGMPTVCGSTGWLKDMEQAKSICQENNTAFIYASNFSIGVNLFFKINALIAKWMYLQKEYAVSIEEIHHTEKKDSPSGTAVTLAEGILEQYPTKSKWVNNCAASDHELLILSKRIDPAPGTHIVHYDSVIDSIQITHTAHNRTGFALGAVLAAEFIVHRKGIFTMQDVLAH